MTFSVKSHAWDESEINGVIISKEGTCGLWNVESAFFYKIGWRCVKTKFKVLVVNDYRENAIELTLLYIF